MSQGGVSGGGVECMRVKCTSQLTIMPPSLDVTLKTWFG